MGKAAGPKAKPKQPIVMTRAATSTEAASSGTLSTEAPVHQATEQLASGLEEIEQLEMQKDAILALRNNADRDAEMEEWYRNLLHGEQGHGGGAGRGLRDVAQLAARVCGLKARLARPARSGKTTVAAPAPQESPEKVTRHDRARQENKPRMLNSNMKKILAAGTAVLFANLNASIGALLPEVRTNVDFLEVTTGFKNHLVEEMDVGGYDLGSFAPQGPGDALRDVRTEQGGGD